MPRDAKAPGGFEIEGAGRQFDSFGQRRRWRIVCEIDNRESALEVHRENATNNQI
jgi:hypothetical protein